MCLTRLLANILLGTKWNCSIAMNISEKKEKALNAIKSAFGTEADEYGATLFVSHHIEEINPEYWKKHLGTTDPDPKSVLDILILNEDSDEEMLDFTLPVEVTDYVVSVTFGKNDEVDEITMES